ncbi:MAG: hypothetical protein P4L41_18315 [Flavipsychrobacter sp.]|nr:hypothetical protein [Flavipsychrobacter sp.]
MTKQFWLNLPSKNVNKSREFFVQMGFKLNEQFGNNAHQASLMIGKKNVILMLFNEETFKSFTGTDIPDITNFTDVLFSIDAESPEEVDEMARKAVAAGGKCDHTPQDEQGWLYGCVFTDLDGHRWNVLHMDMSKMPK